MNIFEATLKIPLALIEEREVEKKLIEEEREWLPLNEEKIPTVGQSVEDEVLEKVMAQENIGRLSAQEKRVIEMLFFHNLTCRQAGQIEGVTRQRVAEIKGEAIQRLRYKNTGLEAMANLRREREG